MLDELGHIVETGRLAATLSTCVVGQDIRYVASTGSTNDDVKLLARAGAREGLVLIADEQTKGRGRRGRSWSAPPGTSLLSSTLLRPIWLPPPDAFYITILAAVACAEAIEEACGIHIELKWPNDLQVGGLKLGGILIETESVDPVLTWAVAGIGLNVDWDVSSNPELAATATTLAVAAGRSVSRVQLLGALLRHLDDRYIRLRAGERWRLFEDWRTRLTTLGRDVHVEAGGTVVEGHAEDVTPDGALIVRDHIGTRHVFSAGDVSIRSPGRRRR